MSVSGRDELDVIHARLLALLQAFDSFCRQENIRYFICGGTLLGAVRHHGFIPWDDDADVVMLRSDYRRLEEAMLDHPPPGTYWRSVSNPRHFPTNHYFGKLCPFDSGIEDRHGGSLGTGHAFGLDVYPLDARPASFLRRQRQRLLSYYYKHLSSLLFGGSSRRHTMVKALIRPILLPFYGSAEDIANCFARVSAMGESGGSDGFVSLNGQYGYARESFPSEWFGGVVPMPFENLTLPAASGWEQMLVQAYGRDWRIPKRDGGAHRHYCLSVASGGGEA